MKKILLPLLFGLFAASCGQSGAGSEHPTDLAGKRALLQEKQTALRTLTEEIRTLETEIAQLDTTKREVQRRTVTTALVSKKDFLHFVEIPATIAATDVVYASSETGGRLLAVNVKDGENVRKGQLIARVDLETVQKQIDELSKSLELANTVFERQSRLWEQNIGSELQYLQAKNNKERLEKSLETLQLQLGKANVYAPISGVVDRVLLKTGELAGPGAPIAQILRTDEVKVIAEVPETYIKAVRKGAVVTIRFPALDEERKEKINLISPTINAGNRTFSAEVVTNNRSGLLKPNLLATMLIQDYAAPNAVTVPVELVQQDVTGNSFVFVAEKKPEGWTAKKVTVTTGESYEGQIEVTSGLQGGETLIIEGARALAAGEALQVQDGAVQ